MDKHLVLISGGGVSTEENSYIEKFNHAFSQHHTFHLTNSTLMTNDCLD
ncbi:hypothetical protein [Vagococcus fluvialis]|nr:hypothetical protein [Vagococcus fluvialis]MBO0438701.1 hypothetical protein [Vagococcus fluvialis]